MITLDKHCTDILVNHWLHNTEDGAHITEQYKSKTISRQEYLDYMYKQTQVWIDMMDADTIASFLKEQEYFNFDISKQLAKLTPESRAAFIVEPVIIQRVNSSGQITFLLDVYLKPGDIMIKRLPLAPDKTNDFLDRLEELGMYVMGMNWQDKPDSPSILIFGDESYCIELRQRLEETYERR